MRETQIPHGSLRTGRRDFGNEVTGPLSRPSPSANLAGIWKGDPLGREVRGLQVHPNVSCGVVAFIRDDSRLFENYVGHHLHRNGDFVFRSVRALRAWLREALTKKFMENIILGIISVALCGYLIVAMICPEKF
jgi:K+-transporting ATPase KdpF subunit